MSELTSSAIPPFAMSGLSVLASCRYARTSLSDDGASRANPPAPRALR
jgi:hypothetical protein